MPAPPLVDAFVRRFVIEPVATGRLDGTTFAVKDLFDVAGHPTGCGNPSWGATHEAPTAHAAVVHRLLAAGARLTGKTRTDELAYSLEGCNVHEGAPLNPAAPTRFTGGSSSGSASAVAAGEVDFAVGSDTAGSVRVPAAWCGLLGFRPTHGRVSVAGLAALSPSFDTVGWMARSGTLMRDVGATLIDDAAAVEGTASIDAAPILEWACDPALDALAAGAQDEPDPAASLSFAEGRRATRTITLDIDWERAAHILRVLQGREAWLTHGRWIDAVRPQFGPAVAARFAAAREIDDAAVRAAELERAALIVRLDTALPRGHVLRLPSVPGPAARRHASSAELQRQRALTLPLTCLASLTGRPQISLPLGLVEGAPVGTALLGWRHGDAALLQLAAAVFP